MEETLYYVESPDGEVLGPMTMMQILEGVAAGAVLDDARICEVGQSDWMDLGDVAMTRETPPPVVRQSLLTLDNDDEAHEAPHHAHASSHEDGLALDPRGSQPVDADDFALPSLPTAGAPAQWTAEIEEWARTTQSLERTLVTEPAYEPPTTIDSNTEFPPFELASGSEGPPSFPGTRSFEPLSLEPSGSADAEHREHLEAVESWDRTEIVPPRERSAASEMPSFADILPSHRSFEDAPASSAPLTDDGALVYEEVDPFSATLETEMPDAQTHGAHMHGAHAHGGDIHGAEMHGSGHGAAGDFTLQIQHADSEFVEETPSKKKLPVSVPVLAAVALAILGGIYVVASGIIGGSKKTSSPIDMTQAAKDPVEAGWRALGDGDPQTAFDELSAAVTEQPDNARAHQGLGIAAMQTDRLDLATAHFERAVELDPKNPAIHLDLGRARLAEGRTELAIEEAQKVRELDPENVPALLVLGHAYTAAKHSDAAVKSLEAYVAKAPKDLDARRDYASALSTAGRMEPAVDVIAPYLESRPEDRKMQAARLDWMLATGRNGEAATLYAKIAAAQPNDGFFQYLAGSARIGTEDAVTYLRRAVQLEPRHREAWVRLATAEASVGRTSDAAASIEKAFALNPPSAQERTLLEKWRGGATAAASAATTHAAADPQTSLAHAQLPEEVAEPTLADRVAEIRRALGRQDFRTAHRALDAASQIPGAEASRNVALWTAIAELEEGKFDAALVGFQDLDASQSYLGFGKGAVRNWIGRTLLVRGKTRAGIAALDEVPPDDPNEYASAQLWEGVALSALGMQDIALRTWKRVREDVGGRVGPSGRASVSSADFLSGAIAEKDYRTAIGSAAEFENDMYFFLGWSARGDAEVARQHFQNAVEASNGHEFPYYLAEAAASGKALTGN